MATSSKTPKETPKAPEIECPDCDGKGCRRCKQKGKVKLYKRDRCVVCDGRGRYPDGKVCEFCLGFKKMPERSKWEWKSKGHTGQVYYPWLRKRLEPWIDVKPTNCPICKSGSFWRDRDTGVVCCWVCHPPANPERVEYLMAGRVPPR